VSEIAERTVGHAFGHRVVIIIVRYMRKPCLENVRAVTLALANVYAFFTFVEFIQPKRCMS
jgi:hypothetical protein